MNSSLANITCKTLLVATLLFAPVCINNAAACVDIDTVCDGEGEPYRPLPGCYEYAQCINGKISSMLSCAEGSIFDELLKQCAWENVSFCIAQSCQPTFSPSVSPSFSPSASPSESPSGSPTASPSTDPSSSPTTSPSSMPSASPTDSPTYDFFVGLETDSVRQKIESVVLQSYNPAGIAFPSTKYSYQGLIESLKEMVNYGIYSDGRTFQFYAGPNQRTDYGRTNLAAFLANAMTESIAYDTCDEFNIDEVADRYALSNACGQNSRSYEDEVCTNSEERDMSCPVDVNMKMTSSGYSTNMMGRAPPPFSCKPKAHAYDYAGYWDGRSGASSKTAYSNAFVVKHLAFSIPIPEEGQILRAAVGNIGKLNYYLGKRAYDERGEGKFPGIDFCLNPEATCASEEGTEELRWITGLFEWIERVQGYPEWSYIDNLEKFVDGGMKDETFFETVSSIFTRGCHLRDCSYSLGVTMKEKRKENFKKVLELLGLPDVTAAPTLSRPLPLATPRPTTQKPVTPSPVKNILPPSMSLTQPAPPISPPNNQNQGTNPSIGLMPTPTQPATPTQQSMPTTPTENTAQNPSQPAASTQPGTPTRPNQNNPGNGDIPDNELVTPSQQATPTKPNKNNNPGNDSMPDNELVRVEDNSASLAANSWWIILLGICSFYL
ncbi:hypothetical protein ACHAXR_004339 [Thalassiosira sp. AJA248-18]